MQEKFSVSEVASLRNNLLRCGLDSFQVADSIKMFVARHGYGISAERALDMANEIEDSRYTVECFHKHLETLALVM